MLNCSGTRVFQVIILLMLLTDAAILLNVPFLRPILAFLFFTVIPGLLILQIMGVNIVHNLKKLVLSVGLSISFLMFLGLLLNSLYPYLLKPLGLYPLIILSNIFIAILTFVAHKRDNNWLIIRNINLNLDLKDKLSSIIIFPMIFPFMAVLGTHLMNADGNNIILLLLIFLIPIYIVIMIYLKDRIHNFTYPFSLWMIGLTLLLINGLTSYHVMGRDVHTEFFVFHTTLTHLHWDISKYLDPYNLCISITILPTIYQVLMNFNNEYIFKLVFALIGSVIPLITYIIFEKVIGKTYAFYASLLFLFQIFFITLLGAVRQEFAFIFFFLAIFVFFDNEINKNARKILFVIFMLSVILSHYSTSYIAIALLTLILFAPFLKSLIVERRLNFTNFEIIIPLFVFIAIWYIFAAQIQVHAANSVVTSTISSSSGVNAAPAEGSSLLMAVFGIGLKSTANWISVLINDLIFALIGIGLIAIIWKFKYYTKKIGFQYMFGIVSSVLLLGSMVIFPFASKLYGAERLFIQVLIFLAPVFVIGVNSIVKVVKKPNLNHVMFLFILISLFICTMNLHSHFIGSPHSPYYENSGAARDEYFIHDEEIVGAKWLRNYKLNNSKVNADLITKLGYANISSNSSFLFKNQTPEGYVFLGYANVVNGKIYKSDDELRNIDNNTATDIKNYLHLFSGKSRIYDNTFVQIYY